jgi:hypothetical protein
LAQLERLSRPRKVGERRHRRARFRRGAATFELLEALAQFLQSLLVRPRDRGELLAELLQLAAEGIRVLSIRGCGERRDRE